MNRRHSLFSVLSWAASKNPTKGWFKGSGRAPLCLPCNITSTKTSMPRSRSTHPGSLKLGSASLRSERCLQWLSRVTLWRGTSHVSFESTMAVTGTSCFGACVEEMEEVIDWENESWEIPAIPEMCAALWVWGRQRCWANCSEMNDTEEQESSSPRATVDKPFEALTMTWHVIKSALVSRPLAVWECKVGSLGDSVLYWHDHLSQHAGEYGEVLGSDKVDGGMGTVEQSDQIWSSLDRGCKISRKSSFDHVA